MEGGALIATPSGRISLLLHRAGSVDLVEIPHAPPLKRLRPEIERALSSELQVDCVPGTARLELLPVASVGDLFERLVPSGPLR